MSLSNLSNLNSESLFQRALLTAPGGVHSPVRSFKSLNRSPIFFKSAEGCYLTSVEGKRYVDFCMSFGPLLLGHRDPEVAEVVHEMVDTAWTFGACEPYSLELAEWIIENVPCVEKLRFVSSGTEAVMSALRVARAATGRAKILKFDGCYHGHADSLLVKAGSGLAGEASTSSAGVPADVAEHTLVAPLNDVDALERIFSERGHEIAALIIEPLPANYGLLIQDPRFLQACASLCKKHGALLMFDEVISGFRVALGGMAELTGIRPDLVCYGKVIGGGFPVGCYGGRADLMESVAPAGPVYQAGTLSANPIGMRAGLATLRKMKRLEGWKMLETRSSEFYNQIRAGLVGTDMSLSTFGSLFWLHRATPKNQPIRSISEIPSEQSDQFKRVFLNCLENGIYLAPHAYEVGFLSLAHSPEVLTKSAQVIVEAIQSTAKV